MNVTGQLSFMKDDGKVLGAGDWFVDNDEAGSFCYSGIWQDGKVIALVFDEHSDSEVVRERGNLFVNAVNAHEALVSALKKISRHTETAAAGDAYDKAMALVDIEYEVRNALIAAGEPM